MINWKAKPRSTLEPTPRDNLPRVIIIIAVLLYLVACFLPAVDWQVVVVRTGRATMDSDLGGELLLLGWIAPVSSVTPQPQFGWYANPFFWLSLYFVRERNWRNALVMGIVALLLALNSFTLSSYESGGFEGEPELLRYVKSGFSIGFYIWLLSIVVVVVGSAVGHWKTSKQRAPASK